VSLAGELAQKILFVHVVLKSLVAIDEDYGNFVSVLAAKVMVSVDVDFAPGESSAARQLRQTFLHDFTEMTSFARVNHYRAWLHDGAILARRASIFQHEKQTLRRKLGTVVGPRKPRLYRRFYNIVNANKRAF
jgi:hypothetical protein